MRAVAIVPTYQNASTLRAILDGLEDAGLSLLVVDDGSTDGTAQLLDAWLAEKPGRDRISFATNRGKGAALAAALAHPALSAFDVALTVDADGQHRIDDARAVLAAAGTNALVTGARDERAPGYPASSLAGRRLWAVGVRSVTGLGVSDPVCGLRAYPLDAIRPLRCRSGRYAWEEELLIRAAWHGIEIREVPIATIYQPRGERVSHFRIVRDWTESLRVWSSLAARCCFHPRPAPRTAQPLRARDGSWRRQQGMAVCLGGLLGLVFPMWIAAALSAFIGWRLRTVWPLAAIGAIGAALLADSIGPWFALPIVIASGWLVTAAARPLCNS